MSPRRTRLLIGCQCGTCGLTFPKKWARRYHPACPNRDRLIHEGRQKILAAGTNALREKRAIYGTVSGDISPEQIEAIQAQALKMIRRQSGIETGWVYKGSTWDAYGEEVA